jgi:hypothetical protein
MVNNKLGFDLFLILYLKWDREPLYTLNKHSWDHINIAQILVMCQERISPTHEIDSHGSNKFSCFILK